MLMTAVHTEKKELVAQFGRLDQMLRTAVQGRHSLLWRWVPLDLQTSMGEGPPTTKNWHELNWPDLTWFSRIFGFIFKGFLASKCNIDYYIWQKSFCELVLGEPQFLFDQPVFCKDFPGTCLHQLTFKNMKNHKKYIKKHQEKQVAI